MLSWDKGEIPVAIVRGSRGGKNDGRVLFMSDKTKAPPNSFVDVELMDGQLQPWLDIHSRVCCYTAGMSGSGKSTYTSNYLCEYAITHPKRPIFIISRLTEDPAFDDIPCVERIPADIVLQDNLTMDSFPQDCCVVFDDVETLNDDKVKKAVQKLRADLLETGRHKNIYVMMTNHNLCDGMATRTALAESHIITVFPRGCSLQQLRYVCKTYLGMDKKEIDHFIKLPSRWVSYVKTYPGCVIFSTGAYTNGGGANKPKSALLR